MLRWPLAAALTLAMAGAAGLVVDAGQTDIGPALELHPRWIEYRDLASMVRDASAVSLGRFVEVDGDEPLLPAYSEVELARYSLSVRQSILGEPHPKLTVLQLKQGTRWNVPSEPPYKVGADYVLFLNERWPDKTDSPFMSIGGPQGQFIVDEGRVYSADTAAQEADWLGVKVHGLPLDDFVKQIKEAV